MTILDVETRLAGRINRVSTNENKNKYDNKIGGITGQKNLMLNQNIPRVIRWFKGRVSYEIHKFNKSFAWQSNYYDHISRNQMELKNFEKYIRDNPSNW